MVIGVVIGVALGVVMRLLLSRAGDTNKKVASDDTFLLVAALPPSKWPLQASAPAQAFCWRRLDNPRTLGALVIFFIVKRRILLATSASR